MKKLIIPFLLTLIFFTQSSAQTLEEILAEHFAVTGQDKLLETENFSTKGKIMQGQYEIPFTSYHKKPFYFKSDASFQGMEIISAFNGETGWTINPFSGNTDPQPLTEEQTDRMFMQADYDGIFYNYEEQGDKLEYVGTEELDDIEVYVLKLTRKNGDVIDSYIDAENYVVLKTKSKMNVQGVESEAETIFSNYKYVDEMLNPFSMETKVNGETVMQMVFDEIAYNVDIDDSIFEMPEITAPADSMEVGTDKEPETETDKQPE